MNRPFLLLTVLLLFCTISRAGIINVPGDQPTIQAGIDSAATGDTVLVADNTYLENINFKGKAITVASHFIMNGDTNHILNTVIDGSQPTNPDSGSVVYFVSAEDTTSILTGFTITGGSGTPLIPPVLYGEEKGGGGIYCWNAGPRITDNRITGNTLSNTDMALGGGLFCFAENNLYHLIVRNNVFSANTVDADSLAGGAGLAIGIDATVENNRVTDNTAISSTVSLGSAIVAANPFAGWGALNFNNNTITHNQATADGITYAAVYSELSDISVIENTIAYNTVSALADCWGAGVFAGFAEGNSIIQNNMISNNTSLSG
ncbi:MAG: hypothetical protein GWO08_10865, partial [Gammaproteobacteria bacterium]|nr:hypothetical protein [Gammaproteobacteria bacterium]NIW97393.1 hypothetical protein [Phycisphaerae bacterium]